jgi:DNA-binding transcriptional LysR family regulator
VTTLQQASRALEPTTGTPKGLLRITAPNDIGSAFVAEVIVEFVERYPLVEVELVATNRTLNLVEEGLDLGLRMGRLAESSLVARKVGEIEACFYASPQYLERHGTPASLSELPAHRLLVFRAKDGDATWSLRTTMGEASVRVHGQFNSDDFGFLRAVTLASGGIGLLPKIVCALDEAEGRLVRVLSDVEMPGAPLFVVYPTARHVPARVTAFRDFFVEAFAARVARSREAPVPPSLAARGKKTTGRHKK